ncbi:MAG TPA: RdgB/HAM1 family non-canonical purine NTP pyrophosphatase [Pseudomonadales bacterium]|nr:RdgB/HAM1 family non-canonical purine NTP pyrophosphatase [Pseudomonadales bacterium]
MKIVLATANPNKVREIQRVLPGIMEVIPQTELDIPSPDETGLTFVENAIIKARHAAELSGMPAIADDSGLEVDYLSGAPGIYSARFAGPDATDADNNEKLLAALADVPAASRTARFQCVIVFMEHALDPAPLISQGTWEGEILSAPRGTSGFGYDPLFLVPALGRSAAELSPDEKHRLSHRGQALTRLHAMMGP